MEKLGHQPDSKPLIPELSQEELRSLIDHAPAIIAIVDREGLIRYINQTVPGYTVEKTVGTSVYEYLPPESHETMRNSLDRVFETGRTTTFQIRGAGPNGTVAWYSSRVGPVFRGGRVFSAAIISTDVTEQKRAEDQARFHAQLLDNVRESVMATDPDGTIIYWGRGAQAQYGYSAEEVLGKPVTLICNPGTEAEEIERIRAVREKGFWVGKYLQRRKNGTQFWAETVISLVRDARGKPMALVGIDRDITEHIRFENALNQSNIRLEQLSRHMIQIQEDQYKMISRELHDSIGQSLSAVRLYLEKIGKDVAARAGGELSRQREEIEQCVSHLRDISRHIRQLSRGMRPEVLDELGLTAALQSFVKDFESRTGIETLLVNELGKRPFPAEVGIHLYRVVQEALNNVYRHAQAKHVRVSLKAQQDELNLSIEDDGTGFAAASLEEGQRSAKGIGLINIQERANLLNGRAEIISSRQRGTRVVIRIPLPKE